MLPQVVCFGETDFVPDESPLLALRSQRLIASLHNHDYHLRWPHDVLPPQLIRLHPSFRDESLPEARSLRFSNSELSWLPQLPALQVCPPKLLGQRVSWFPCSRIPCAAPSPLALHLLCGLGHDIAHAHGCNRGSVLGCSCDQSCCGPSS